jgi:hypothetical protein
MKLRFLQAKPADAGASPAPDPAPWTFGPADSALAAAMLTLVVAVSLPIALRQRQEAAALQRDRERVADRCRMIRAALRDVERQEFALGRIRRESNRWVSEIEARPIVPWTTAIGELSRRRPRGVRAVRLSGNGPRFRAQIVADAPETAQAYAHRLMESPYVDFAGLPGAAGSSTRTQVVGRLMGD